MRFTTHEIKQFPISDKDGAVVTKTIYYVASDPLKQRFSIFAETPYLSKLSEMLKGRIYAYVCGKIEYDNLINKETKQYEFNIKLINSPTDNKGYEYEYMYNENYPRPK